MVIYLAGLQGVPDELYEAAEIDGAGALAQVLARHAADDDAGDLLQPVIGIIASFQVFTHAYVMTGGGPANATLFYVLYLYQHGF